MEHPDPVNRRPRRTPVERNVPIREWVEEERPREIILRHGAEQLPPAKLLAVVLRTGRPGVSAEELARRLLNAFGSLRGMDAATLPELCRFDGIGPAKAAQIKAALEIGKRLTRERASAGVKIESPEDAVRYVMEYYGPYLRDKGQEHCFAILLDRRHRPIRHLEVSRGGRCASIVDPREIVREAALHSAEAVLLIHNHPTGDVRPSTDDLRLTRRVRKGGELLDIRLLDHIIIGKNAEDFYSFARRRRA
jgi:DNA repair protein RadC